jgi:predicted TIM-barrel fold metal-dependent hydrolase
MADDAMVREAKDQLSMAPETASGLDRRSLLVAAGSALVTTPAFAQVREASPRSSQRIDAHSHFSSLKYLDALEKHEGKPFVLGAMYRRTPTLTDSPVRLGLLDRHEIDLQVLVPVPWLEAFPGVVKDQVAAPQMARLMNDELAAVVAKEPKRFRAVAVLPTVNSDAMVSELNRAVKELGFCGGYVAVGPTAKPMDHSDFEALYKAVVDLDVSLWLHPSRPPLPDIIGEAVSKYSEWIDIGWPYDTTTAMYRIVFSGVFERHPTIRIITHHHGGMVPYYAGRMAGVWAGNEEHGILQQTQITKPYIEHFKKFHCDTACNEFAPKVLELALDFFGQERMLFGTDAPFGAGDGERFTTEVLRSVEGMQVSQPTRNAILSGNVRRILKLA